MGDSALDVDRQDLNGSPVLCVRGDIDVATAPVLRNAIADLPVTAPIVLDLAGVTFMDSSGIRVLVHAMTGSDGEPRSLSLQHIPAHVRRLLGVTGLDDLIADDGFLEGAR